MRKFGLTLIAAAALGAIGLAAAPVLAEKPLAKAVPYVPKVTLTATGNPVFGNPAAPTKIVEYLSYSCGHCAHFHKDEYKTVRDDYIATGKASLEIRPVMHDVVGYTAALTVSCSKPGYYYRTHALFMETQDVWLGKILAADAATMKTFQTGAPLSRVKAVARHAGFYTMMAKRGTSEAQLNACLADQKTSDRIMANGAALSQMRQGQPTPTFLINGKLAGGVGTMPALLPALGK